MSQLWFRQCPKQLDPGWRLRVAGTVRRLRPPLHPLLGDRAEQLARQGRARWMVDNGDWARIERGVVASYDAAADALCGSGPEAALPAAQRLVEGTVEELGNMLESLGLR